MVQEIYEGGVIFLLSLGLEQTSLSPRQSGTSMLHREKTVYNLHSWQIPFGSSLDLQTERSKGLFIVNHRILSY